MLTLVKKTKKTSDRRGSYSECFKLFLYYFIPTRPRHLVPFLNFIFLIGDLSLFVIFIFPITRYLGETVLKISEQRFSKIYFYIENAKRELEYKNIKFSFLNEKFKKGNILNHNVDLFKDLF